MCTRGRSGPTPQIMPLALLGLPPYHLRYSTLENSPGTKKNSASSRNWVCGGRSGGGWGIRIERVMETCEVGCYHCMGWALEL